jgi:hypothetical protein
MGLLLLLPVLLGSLQFAIATYFAEAPVITAYVPRLPLLLPARVAEDIALAACVDDASFMLTVLLKLMLLLRLLFCCC